MEEDMISPAEINSIAYLNKKRKSQAELLDTPLPKHVCWGQKHEYEFSSDLSTEPKMVSGSIAARGVESLRESVSNSYSFPSDADSSMSSCDDTKTHASVCWEDTSSQTGVYSIESSSETKESSKKSESMSMSEYGLLPSDNYEDRLIYGGHGDCSFSMDQVNGVEDCTNTDLEDLLYSNGVDASNYVLSSGRWPVGQGGQEKTKKLTIDKEFEEYFSMLML